MAQDAGAGMAGFCRSVVSARASRMISRNSGRIPVWAPPASRSRLITARTCWPLAWRRQRLASSGMADRASSMARNRSMQADRGMAGSPGQRAECGFEPACQSTRMASSSRGTAPGPDRLSPARRQHGVSGPWPLHRRGGVALAFPAGWSQRRHRLRASPADNPDAATTPRDARPRVVQARAARARPDVRPAIRPAGCQQNPRSRCSIVAVLSEPVAPGRDQLSPAPPCDPASPAFRGS